MNNYKIVGILRCSNITYQYIKWDVSNSSAVFEVDRKNAVVRWNINIFGSGVENGSEIAALTDGFKPIKMCEVFGEATQISGTGKCCIRIHTDGKIKVDALKYNENITEVSFSGIYNISN